MNNFQTTIGIEIHTSIKTKTKMFSPAESSHHSNANSNVHPIDIGLPGTMPRPNAAAVEKAIILCRALQMEVDSELTFDRKNYFYSDLPKGFQITQQFRPIGKNGKVFLSKKTVDIERVHIEEDTAKQQTINGEIHLDYNRCGIPLVEIVTGPSLNSPEEVSEFLTSLKRVLIFSDVSDGKMEDGSLRVDLNISINLLGSKKLGTRVEIKNINSFANVTKAIEFEKNRQIDILLKNGQVSQETRRWDESSNKTIFMREKINPNDYRYMIEPNIVRISIPNSLLSEISSKSPKLPHEIQTFLSGNGVGSNLIDQLLDNHELYKKFEYVYKKISDIDLSITWIIIELGALCKKEKISYFDVPDEFIERTLEMLFLLKDKKISGKQAKTLFEKMYSTGNKCSELIEKLDISQITDKDLIEKMLIGYIEQNPQMILQYNDRPERVEKFFIGLIMRDTKGQVNPSITIESLRKLINQKN